MSKPDKDLTRELEKWAASEEGSKAINTVLEKALQRVLNKWATTGHISEPKKKMKKVKKIPELGFGAIGEKLGDR